MAAVEQKKKKVSWIRIIFWVSITVLAVVWYHGMMDPLKAYLSSDDLKFKLGKLELTPFRVLKAAFMLIFLLWLSGRVSSFAERTLRNSSLGIRKSSRALIIKILNISLYLIVGLLAMYVLGVDITTITVFGGALGIGIGFGLQKIASNFISGLILLFERSINEGDLVELSGGGFGFVAKIYARYTLVETFDGKEIMIPNEDFITARVTNWTYSNRLGRFDIDIGVAYGTDPHRAKEIILEVAKNQKTCSKRKEPEVYLLNFGESSVDFKLLMWLDDITEGRYSTTDSILMEIWDRFKEEGIEIPFPQRDIHVKTPIEIIKK